MKIQQYKTINSQNESELKEKKSLFIAKAYAVSTDKEVNRTLIDLKQKYYGAAHHCYAYRLLSGKSKFSDAGEPSGTAGIKILKAIDHYELTNCLVVVIRYFGGIKLGIGPLGKAYYQVVIKVLSESDIVIKRPYLKMKIKLDISSYDKLIKFLVSNKISVVDTIFGSETILECFFPIEILDKIKTQINDLLRGKVVFLTENEQYFK